MPKVLERRVARLVYEVLAAHAAMPIDDGLIWSHVALAYRWSPTPCNISQVANMTGLDPKTVRRHTRKLVSQGLLRPVGGRYEALHDSEEWHEVVGAYMRAASPWLRKVIRSVDW